VTGGEPDQRADRHEDDDNREGDADESVSLSHSSTVSRMSDIRIVENADNGSGFPQRRDNGGVLDPELAAVLLAAAFAGLLAIPELRKKLRRTEQRCESCGRRILLGEQTCDCAD
jgi:hypothetical protein